MKIGKQRSGTHSHGLHKKIKLTIKIIIISTLLCLIGIFIYQWIYSKFYIYIHNAKLYVPTIPIISPIDGKIDFIYAENEQAIQAGELILELNLDHYHTQLEDAKTKFAFAATQLQLSKFRKYNANVELKAKKISPEKYQAIIKEFEQNDREYNNINSQIQLIENHLQHHQIIAKQNGWLTNFTVIKDQPININQKLGDLVLDEPYLIIINLPLEQRTKIYPGKMVSIIVKEFADFNFQGVIMADPNEPNKLTTRSKNILPNPIQIKILNNPFYLPLKPDMEVSIKIKLVQFDFNYLKSYKFN